MVGTILQRIQNCSGFHVIYLPSELHWALEADPFFKVAWGTLTPGKRRSHRHQVNLAKQESTKERRIQQIIELTKASTAK